MATIGYSFDALVKATIKDIGGTLTGTLNFSGSTDASFNGGKLRVYHDGSGGYVHNTDEHLFIDNQDRHVYIRANKSGAIQTSIAAISNATGTYASLYYDGTAQLTTVNGGVDLTDGYLRLRSGASNSSMSAGPSNILIQTEAEGRHVYLGATGSAGLKHGLIVSSSSGSVHPRLLVDGIPSLLINSGRMLHYSPDGTKQTSYYMDDAGICTISNIYGDVNIKARAANTSVGLYAQGTSSSYIGVQAVYSGADVFGRLMYSGSERVAATNTGARVLQNLELNVINNHAYVDSIAQDLYLRTTANGRNIYTNVKTPSGVDKIVFAARGDGENAVAQQFYNGQLSTQTTPNGMLVVNNADNNKRAYLGVENSNDAVLITDAGAVNIRASSAGDGVRLQGTSTVGTHTAVEVIAVGSDVYAGLNHNGTQTLRTVANGIKVGTAVHLTESGGGHLDVYAATKDKDLNLNAQDIRLYTYDGGTTNGRTIALRVSGSASSSAAYLYRSGKQILASAEDGVYLYNSDDATMNTRLSVGSTGDFRVLASVGNVRLEPIAANKGSYLYARGSGGTLHSGVGAAPSGNNVIGQLRYNSSTRLSATSGGVSVTGGITTGGINSSGTILLENGSADSPEITFVDGTTPTSKGSYDLAFHELRQVTSTASGTRVSSTTNIETGTHTRLTHAGTALRSRLVQDTHSLSFETFLTNASPTMRLTTTNDLDDRYILQCSNATMHPLLVKSSGGITVDGGIDLDGSDLNIRNNSLLMHDNNNAQAVQIVGHDGNAYFRHTGNSGNMIFRSYVSNADVFFQATRGNGTVDNAIQIANGSDSTTVHLRYNGVNTLHTTSYGIHIAGELQASGDVRGFVTSDERVKTKITPISNALDKVDGLRTVSYNKKDVGAEVGLIAQDVEKLGFADLVQESDELLKIRSGGNELIALAFAAIKELTAKVKELEGK